MKILKLKTSSGFKMLEKEFSINFLTKTRIDRDSENNDLLEIENNCYYPIETVFIGKNSSGKTTVLELITIAFELLNDGRIRKAHFDYGESFEVEIIFYVAGNIYRYNGEFKNDSLDDKTYLTIKNESLGKTSFKDSYKKDLSNANFFKVNEFIININGDTSSVVKYSDDRSFNYSLERIGDNPANFSIFYSLLGEEIFLALLHLFDDSVEYLKPITDDANLKNSYIFKRVGSAGPVTIDSITLKRVLSKGTVRGINLYALSIITFINGGHLIVDEIEGSFNRNLIENLILMFNDKTINKKGGSIIYSTHYSELLDLGNRCDNVNVLHRNDNTITLKNMHDDYSVRTEMVKSSQFDQNTFDTLINYNRLMDLKDALRKE